MPLVRSKSQSSPIQSANLFFQHWGRRRPSVTAHSSPLMTPSIDTSNTDSFPTSSALSQSLSSEHSMQLNQQCQDTTATNNNQQEYRSTCPTNSSTTTQSPYTTTTDETESINTTTTRIRLLPSVELTSRSFVFDIIDCDLTMTTIWKICRYSERHSTTPDRLSFKSKVVSRAHAELSMTSEKKIYIRDIGSSSGTFVNRVRLSRSHETSQPMELKDGDIIQLGIDYQGGGMDQKYLAVKIRLEINNFSGNNTFRHQAFQQFRHLLCTSLSNKGNTGSRKLEDGDDRPDGTMGLSEQQHHDQPGQQTTVTQNNNNNDDSPPYIQECCICLYDIAPLQALFIAPCSHIYHFKCIRPLLQQHYPGFSCPLCRNYCDLEASVTLADTTNPPPMTTTTTTNLDITSMLTPPDQDGIFGNVLSYL